MPCFIVIIFTARKPAPMMTNVFSYMKIPKFANTVKHVKEMCMFKHECNAETNEINVNEEESVTGDDIFVIDDQEEFIGQENETSKRTF